MAAEDWIDCGLEDLIDDEYFEPRIIPQAEFQNDKNSWRTSLKYVPVSKLENSHLLNCIHMMERKSLNEYDPVPKVYDTMIKEARKRKLIKR